MRDYATRCQQVGDTAGKFFAPKHAATTTLRNRFFGTRTGMKTLLDTGKDRIEHITVPTYDLTP